MTDPTRTIAQILDSDLQDYRAALTLLKHIYERAVLAHEQDGLMNLIADVAGEIARTEMRLVQAQSLERSDAQWADSKWDALINLEMAKPKPEASIDDD